MNELVELVVKAFLIGCGATVVMDLWALFLKSVFKLPSLNYAFVGRWLGHMPQGKFTHNTIVESPPVRGERLMGWGAHYAIGVAFALVLLVFWGLDWAKHPTFFPAIFIGVVTIVAPFFLMQPCFGFGVAASRLPRPNFSRLLSLGSHSAYGVGLYLAALFWGNLL